MKKRKYIATRSLLAVAAVLILHVVFYGPVCRDLRFICENTGSYKGYRQWLFGLKTGHWYEKAPLEEFIQSQGPAALVHRWTYCQGTGRNFVGMPVSCGLGSPGEIMRLDYYSLSFWMRHNDPAKIRQLYDLLVSDDQDAIKKRVMEIREGVLEY